MEIDKCEPATLRNRQRRNFLSPLSAAIAFAIALNPASLFAFDENAVGPPTVALNQIFGEQILNQNGSAVTQRAVEESPKYQFQTLSNWLLPDESHSAIRFPVSLSTSKGIQSPVLELVRVAVQLDISADLQQRLLDAKQHPPNVRPVAAFELLLQLAINPDSTDTARAFEAFMSATDAANLNLEEPDWPRLLVLSQAIGVRHFDVLVTDLLAPYYPLRAIIFDEPVKDAFFDHMRSLSGRHTYTTIHAGEVSKFTRSPPLQNWIATSDRNSRTHGKGAPQAHWQVTEDGVSKLSGHEFDYLTYRLPLQGNFVVEFDASANSVSVILAGIAIDFTRDNVSYGGVGNPTFKQTDLNPPLSPFRDWNHFRAVVQDGVLTAHVNGRAILSVALPEQNDPWFAVRSWRRWQGTLRNFQISGQPDVPRRLGLIENTAAFNWTDYFGRGTHWNLISNTNINMIVAMKHPELAGAFAENLTRYFRPITEDGSISYDFFYQPREILVHPAVGRMCFILAPDGIRVHKLTDANADQTNTDPAKMSSVSSLPLKALPLIADAWNSMRVDVKGDTLQLFLNDASVRTANIPQDAHRDFGLFHYSDQTAVRVRNVVWDGGWQTDASPLKSQKIRDQAVDAINKRSAELTATFHHDFRDGIPSELFDFSGVEDTFEQVESGIRLHRGVLEKEFQILSNMQLCGDFDVIASFSDLESRLTTGKHAGIGLWIEYGSTALDDVGIYRRKQNVGGERIQHAHKWVAQDGKKKFRGNHVPEESTSGKLRISRRGREIYYMYAEADSEHFRVIHNAEVTDADTKANRVSLVMHAVAANESSVTWESLSIRAEGFRNHWNEQTEKELIQRLDARRANLAPFEMNLADQASTEVNLSTLQSESNGKFVDSGLRVTTTDDMELPIITHPIQNCLDIEVVVDITRIDAPTNVAKHNEVALLLWMDSDYLDYASIMLRRKALGAAEVFCQTRETNLAGKSNYWPLRSLPVKRLRRMRFAILDQTLYYLYSETVDGPYKILAEHRFRDKALPRTLYLRSEANGPDSTVEVVWQTASLFETPNDAEEQTDEPQ